MTDVITIRGIRARGRHGVYEHERTDGQEFVVDVALRVSTAAAAASDDLADQLFDERPLSRGEQLHAFRLRTALSQVRRLTEPMRAVLSEILANPAPTHGRKATGTSQVHRRWTLVNEHHVRVANAADALREALSSIFDTSLALSDLRLNEVMKKLTGWAAIIAVPTLISGFVGMNVDFPLDGTAVGFWVYFVLMLVTALVLYVVFRVKQWI